MKLLIISHFGLYDNTPRAFRTLELVRALTRKGYDIDLLIGSEFTFYENYKDGDIKQEKKETKSDDEKKFRIIRKFGSNILNFIYGDMVIMKYYRKNLRVVKDRKYEVIISIGQPFYPHMISAKCRIGNPIRIADCGDPFYVKGKKMGVHVKMLQKNVFKRMSYISIPTEKAVEYYSEYVNCEKIKIIPQGVDFDKYSICEYKKNNIPTFAYAGLFYDKIRDPRKFLNYILNLNLDYNFIIYTNINDAFYKKEIEPIVNKERHKIKVYDLVTREKCIYELSKMDFVVNFENISTTQAPSKLIDYGIIKRPVISFSENTFSEDDFKQFLNGNYINKLDFDISQFDINVVANKFESLFNK